jgi:type II secretory pathway predicted ATPase ExeA
MFNEHQVHETSTHYKLRAAPLQWADPPSKEYYQRSRQVISALEHAISPSP